MSWDVEFTEEFSAWWDSLTAAEQDDVETNVMLLILAEPQFC